MRPSKICPSCNQTVSNSGFDRHVKACDGKGTFWSKSKFHVEESWKQLDGNYSCPCCRYLGTKQALAAHYSKNHHNPELTKTANYRNGMIGLTPWNSGLTAETNETVKKASIRTGKTLKHLYATGQLKMPEKAIFKTDAFRKKMQDLANNRFEKGQGTAKGAWVFDSFGTKCYLGSSYEIEVARILTSLQVKWLRPEFVWYTDDLNFKRKYFPDLYLPAYNLYLDPKNSFLLLRHARKLQLVKEQNQLQLEVITEHQLSTEYIRELLTRYKQASWAVIGPCIRSAENRALPS